MDQWFNKERKKERKKKERKERMYRAKSNNNNKIDTILFFFFFCYLQSFSTSIKKSHLSKQSEIEAIFKMIVTNLHNIKHRRMVYRYAKVSIYIYGFCKIGQCHFLMNTHLRHCLSVMAMDGPTCPNDHLGQRSIRHKSSSRAAYIWCI